VSAAELSSELERTFLRHGFTTVFDVGSPWRGSCVRRCARVASGEVTGPRILTVRPRGVSAGREGRRAPSTSTLHTALEDMPEVETPEEARAIARTLLDAAPTASRCTRPPGGTSRPHACRAAALRAIVEEAGARQKPVFAHPSDQAGIEAALAAGVHVLTHTTPAARPWPADLAARLRQHDVALTPTLTLWRVELERTGVVPRRSRRCSSAPSSSSGQFVEAGGTVLFGTDVGYIPEHDDPAEEYRLMAAAGMDARQVLASLTTAPAARFGACDRGARRARIPERISSCSTATPPRRRGVRAVARVIRAGRTSTRRRDDGPRALALRSPAAGA
jgi:imidazolonepropionase-like amidohydrolase